MKKTLNLLYCFAATLFLTGCMGYQLGGSRLAGTDSVYVAPATNNTGEAAIELQVTKALRERIQFDGRLKLANSAEVADAVIETTLSGFRLTPIAFRSGDRRTTAQQYRLRIDGSATLKATKSGKIISSSESYGEATFDFESDLTSSKRNAHPVAARDLAKFMIDDLIEAWQ